MTPVGGDFERDGFIGPVPLLTSAECAEITAHLRSDERPAPVVWFKGKAATDWRVRALGADPRLLELLTPVLGDNIILWGATFVQRIPGYRHPWHVDIESAAPDGRFATVWIGLENTSSDSSLRLIAGSHLCGKTVQQMRAENGCDRKEAATETVVEWARSANPDARLVEPEARDGEGILFDGRMWHGSRNRHPTHMRSALLLQFAAAECPVRIPDVFDWPFHFKDTRPPVIVVQGRADVDANLVIPPPRRPGPVVRAAGAAGVPALPATPGPVEPVEPLSAGIRQLNYPLAEKDGGGWRRYPLFKGATRAVEAMSCHAAVLSPGHSPHLPHTHNDEELVIVLDGQAELLIDNQPGQEGPMPVQVKAGDVAYYPALQGHSIRNVFDAPVTYMMYRWRRPSAAPAGSPLPTMVLRDVPAAPPVQGRGFTTRCLFDGPTRWLRKLHCHRTRLEPGAGYAPHVDPYDVGIVIQSGRVRTLRQEVGPGGIIYYPAGEMHGMRNIGDEPAHYLVFEFHGAPLATARPALGQGIQAHLSPPSHVAADAVA